jgi:hypothetical protein
MRGGRETFAEEKMLAMVTQENALASLVQGREMRFQGYAAATSRRSRVSG